MCTMVPMRSVPHRVVCLVGLDDGVFPRLGVVDGDDTLARDPMTGERDIRSEDRQLLLDAIGAATEKLVITYTGAQPILGSPPTAGGAAGRTAGHPRLDHTGEDPHAHRRRTSVAAVRHSQRHSRRTGAECAVQLRPDRAARREGQRRRAQRASRVHLQAAALPTRDDVILADLIGFFSDPVKGFFRALEFTLPRDVDGIEDAMPVDLDNLEEWTVGDRILHDILRA